MILKAGAGYLCLVAAGLSLQAAACCLECERHGAGGGVLCGGDGETTQHRERISRKRRDCVLQPCPARHPPRLPHFQPQAPLVTPPSACVRACGVARGPTWGQLWVSALL